MIFLIVSLQMYLFAMRIVIQFGLTAFVFLVIREVVLVDGLRSPSTCVILSKTGTKVEYKCPVCGKIFKSEKSLIKHETDTRHFLKGSTADIHFYRRKFILDFEKAKVKVEEEDRKKSVNLTKSVLDSLIKEIRKYPGGKIYSPAIRKAGSYAVNTKIGKADEFDTNIVLKIGIENVRTKGDLGYIFEDKVLSKKGSPSTNNLKTNRRLVDHANISIPKGQASVAVEQNPKLTNLTYKGDLIPYMVKKDLYRRLQQALNVSSFKGVHLYREAHGPALTLTIMQEGDHHISVDLTTSIPCNLSVTRGGWPRPDTRKALSQSLINATIAVGMHLVPKGDETWSISFSKAERKLMESIDVGHGCRRRVMKMLKRHVQVAASRAGFKLIGISSHIIKNQVLWSSERRYANDYWNEINIDVCLLDTMEDLIQSLREVSLPSYFSSDENILSGKNRTILNYLADYFDKERKQILNIPLVNKNNCTNGATVQNTTLIELSQTTASNQHERSSTVHNTSAKRYIYKIVGGVVAAVGLVLCIVIAIIVRKYYKRRRRRVFSTYLQERGNSLFSSDEDLLLA